MIRVADKEWAIKKDEDGNYLQLEANEANALREALLEAGAGESYELYLLSEEILSEYVNNLANDYEDYVLLLADDADNEFDGYIFHQDGLVGKDKNRYFSHQQEINLPDNLKKFTVEYVSEGEVVDTQYVYQGRDAHTNIVPERTGYGFDGWEGDQTNIQEDTTFHAKWNANEYTVTFKDGYSEGVLGTESVKYGKPATAPETPTRNGYEFTGWDKDLDRITGGRNN